MPRDYRKEESDHTDGLAKADLKVHDLELLLASMKPGDPRRPEAERLLDQMRQNASSAETNRAFSRYDDTGA